MARQAKSAEKQNMRLTFHHASNTHPVVVGVSHDLFTADRGARRVGARGVAVGLRGVWPCASLAVEIKS